MNRAVGILAFVLVVPSAALAADPVAAYREAIEFCAGEHTAMLDDGVTPANVVGQTLLAICRGKHSHLYSAATAAWGRAYMAGYEAEAAKEFTAYVLWHRTKKKSVR